MKENLPDTDIFKKSNYRYRTMHVVEYIQGVLISDVITAIGQSVNAWDQAVCSTI